MFRAVRANYEETQRKLLLENSDFRCALCSLQNELIELVQMGDPNISLASAMTTSEDGIDSTQVSRYEVLALHKCCIVVHYRVW